MGGANTKIQRWEHACHTQGNASPVSPENKVNEEGKIKNTSNGDMTLSNLLKNYSDVLRIGDGRGKVSKSKHRRTSSKLQ